jgi:putative addiction module killer protein
MDFQVLELLQQDGTSPFGRWFDGLDSVAAAKVTTAVTRMSEGNLSSVKWFEGIGEFKINWGPGYRLYLAKDGIEVILLLGGGTKKGQQKDISRALALWSDYKHRKQAAKHKR